MKEYRDTKLTGQAGNRALSFYGYISKHVLHEKIIFFIKKRKKSLK